MPTPTTKPYVVNVRLLEVFPAPPGLVPLYLESVATSIDTAMKFYDETAATAARRRAS